MNTAPLRRPEILAPAGDDEALRAAVKAGADAVYFGLKGMNARARAKNFDSEELARTMAYLHEHGVKGYVTLNTLVFDSELAAAEAAARACAKAGADAVIVQDLGVARMVRAVAPELPIHASTQMTCADAGAVELAREIGASRVILARELSIGDIAAIRRATDVDVEVFVHGALCVAYSGQCLTSEAIGGRSANRGACAQACRLPYELVVDGELRDLGDQAYLLSPEDLEASALVPKLMELGVASLKIEGRLKGPAYVGATTRLYRSAVDAALSGEPEPDLATLQRAALQMYSRGSGPGFLAGIDHSRLVEGRACDHRGLLAGELLGAARARGKTWIRARLASPIARGDGILIEGGFGGEGEIGGRVWSITRGAEDVERAAAGEVALLWLGPDQAAIDVPSGRRIWKTSDPSQERAVLAAIEQDPHRTPIEMRVSGALDEAPRFEARTASGLFAEVIGDAPVTAARSSDPAALLAAALRDKLGRLGDTPFRLGSLTVDLPPGAMIPPSSLNRARRALSAALLAAAQRSHATTSITHENLIELARPPDRSPPPGGLFVLCRTREQAEAALEAGADGVYLDFLELTGTGAAFRALRSSGGSQGRPLLGLAPPRIRKPGEEKIDRYLLSLEPDMLLVRGLGALASRERRESARSGDEAGSGPLRVGDFSLNITNRLSAADVLARDLGAFTPSFDLDAAQLVELLSSPFGAWAEVVIHHPMPLFHMEHCVIAALLSSGKDHTDCGRPCETHKVSLRDRAGMDHPVEADVGCRNTVFHAAAQSAASVVSAALSRGASRFRIELVREGAADVTSIVRTYRRLLVGEVSAPEVWRALSAEGGYGVVKGSLRVLSP